MSETMTANARIWSPQQTDIFEQFKTGRRHFVVRARAGTGKTTTILEGLKSAPEQRILFAAFNKRIVEEVTPKNQNPNVEVKTLHGVGFACVRRYRERVQVARGNDREVKIVEEVCGTQAPDVIKRLVGKLMTKAREMAPLATDAGQLLDLAEEFECIPDEQWLEMGFDTDYVEARALECMNVAAQLKTGEEIDYADMLFLPVRNGWLHKIYDMTVVDEAQDMNATQLIIARGVTKGRVVVVGDDRQAIYSFRGADSNSLDRLKDELQAEERGLTVTYRCASRIVEQARLLVPDLTAAPGAAEGSVTSIPFDKLVDAAQPGDFILSRANAPLASIAMAMIRANKRVRIQGKDIGQGLKAMIRKIATGRAANSIPEFLARLVRWEDREIDRVMKANRPEQTEQIRDKAETLRCLCDGIAGTRELEARIDMLFADSGGAAVICSSVHKAKGLEASRVFVLRYTLYPKLPKEAKPSPMRVREEQNIHYVAITRAMNELVYVMEPK
jgi:DNA helicase-2/ATP-dependent DNA helicase PcrA